MGIESAEKSEETRVDQASQHVKHTEISVWTQINIYIEAISVLICP